VAGEPVTVAIPGVRDWRSVVFAPLGDGQRRRRGSDGVRLAVAVLATLCAVLALRSNSRPEQVIAGVLSPPPDGVRWLVDVFWIGGSFGTVAALLLLAAVRRRWDALRDLAIAAGGALAVSGILVLALGVAAGRPETASRTPALTAKAVQAQRRGPPAGERAPDRRGPHTQPVPDRRSDAGNDSLKKTAARQQRRGEGQARQNQGTPAAGQRGVQQLAASPMLWMGGPPQLLQTREPR
jgi:hypothetical protein